MATLPPKWSPTSSYIWRTSHIQSFGRPPIEFCLCKGRCSLPVIGCSTKDPASEASTPMRSFVGQKLIEDTGNQLTFQENISCIPDDIPPSEQKRPGTNVQTLLKRFWKVAAPYWNSDDRVQARLRLGGVFALTLATTGISVGFNFLGRDFYNALASKDQEQFMKQLLYYLGAFIGGIPFFVLRDYGRDTLSLRWRAWMTSNYLDQYFKNRAFYQIQSQSIIDNPDQRIVDDLNSFTGTALSFALAIFNAAIDLISFSGILYGIYPPLFFILIAYSIGGTAVSVALGKGLVNLNFQQEKKEADFRFGLVRIRENSESIAFYQGERNEIQLLLDRFKRLFENYSDLLVASRNLEFFQSGYRYIIQVLPAAVVAPMYFSGKIEFGVINQSYSAFNHILSDFSIVIYQFQALSAFSAVIDRLGEFTDVLEKQSAEIEEVSTDLYPLIDLVDRVAPASSPVLLQIENLSLQTPQYTMTLIKDLTLTVCEGQSLLVMGASGSGKTSLLRAIAGLWRSGRGIISRFILPLDDNSDGAPLQTLDVDCENIASMTEEETTRGGVSDGRGSILFLPQRPYMVLGTLRQQLLYPTWSGTIKEEATSNGKGVWDLPVQSGRSNFVAENTPSDNRLEQVLLEVNLGNLLERCEGLDSQVEWSSILSLGEQQRLAFARLLLARPRLALLDESTSALDEDNEAALYNLLQTAGITYISVGHRSSLCKFHSIRLTVEEPRQAGLDRNWNVDYLTA